MAPQLAPGRPSNLTPEEEVKLKEFWVALAGVVGIEVPEQGPATKANGTAPEPTENGVAPAMRSRADTTDSTTKKKKGRLGLFGRKKADEDEEIVAPLNPGAVPAPLASTAEDKYDQTKDFKSALASQTPEELRTAVWNMAKHDNPDALLLRFLRARKWVVADALVMLIATMHWRAKEMHLDDDIMPGGEGAAIRATQGADEKAKKDGVDFLAQMRTGKSYMHGVDNEGRPICYIKASLHRKGEQSDESLERFTVYGIETARFLMAPPVDTACLIFDLTGFSMANMDYAPLKFMIKCFEANYPESLGVVLVHKAPWIFQGIWRIIRGWLDPVVAAKVNFTQTVEELEHYVSRDHIPKDLGGDEDWSWHYVEPSAGEDSLLADAETRQKILAERATIVRDFEQATVAWIAPPANADVEALRAERERLAGLLRENYWRLDPYIRAHSVYDRTGVISAGGKLNFYPDAKPNGVAADTPADALAVEPSVKAGPPPAIAVPLLPPVTDVPPPSGAATPKLLMVTEIQAPKSRMETVD
ncbi:MAG: hypothetical protein M1832_002928 [Thelocarpon impressellum]|nr:MAG: hypothetical protein M1832_002928 [Thelocarpon impressellum]